MGREKNEGEQPWGGSFISDDSSFYGSFLESQNHRWPFIEPYQVTTTSSQSWKIAQQASISHITGPCIIYNLQPLLIEI